MQDGGSHQGQDENGIIPNKLTGFDFGFSIGILARLAIFDRFLDVLAIFGVQKEASPICMLKVILGISNNQAVSLLSTKRTCSIREQNLLKR